mgnify:FL=1
MRRRFSLAYLTVPGVTPPEQTYIAARAGYDFVSFRLAHLGVADEPEFEPLNPAVLRRTQDALRETGLSVLDVELARIVPERAARDYLPAMEAAAMLGARHMIASAWTKGKDDRDFVVARYAEICDLARPYGLTVDLEFPTFSRLGSLAEARDVVEAAGEPNAGILVDALYFHFSRCGQNELLALPRHWVNFIHLCDAGPEVPQDRDAMKRIAREGRLYVGEGAIDLPTLAACLPEVPFSVELPNARRTAELGHVAHARRCLDTARAYFDGFARASAPRRAGSAA